MEPSTTNLYRILLVDDDEFIRIMLGELLVREGYTVFPASDGLEAAALLTDIAPDIVLTDHNMPRMDGWDLALLIRRQYPRMPILLITADPGWLTKVYDSKNPFDGILVKPFQMRALLSMINALLKGSGQQERKRHGREIQSQYQPEF